MASGTFSPYDTTFAKFFNTTYKIDGSSSLYMMFTSASHTPNAATHDFENDLTNVVSGTNLSSAGVALGSVSVSLSSGVVKFDVADVSEANVTATGIRNLHIVDKTAGSSSANQLVAYCTLDGDISPNAGTLAVTIHADGYVNVDLHP